MREFLGDWTAEEVATLSTLLERLGQTFGDCRARGAHGPPTGTDATAGADAAPDTRAAPVARRFPRNDDRGNAAGE